MITTKTGITAKFLALAAIFGMGVFSALVLWGCSGCSRTTAEYGQHSNAEGLSGVGIRPARGETTRVLRNAHYLKMMGRPELALKELEAAYQEDPGNLRVLDTLARTYEEVGEFDRAQKLYQQALSLEPSNQALNNNLCFSYYLTGQYGKAETCFRQALAKNPQNLTVRNNLGLLLCRLGRTEEALRLWQETEGEVAARKKIQQVMVALGTGDQPQYARKVQPVAPPAPVASASPPKPIAPAAAPAPASQPQAPAAAPAKVRQPVKLAAKAAPPPLQYPQKPAAPVTAQKSASPQPQKPAVATKAKTPSPVTAKTSAVAAQKKARAEVPAAPGPSRQAAPALKKTAPAKPAKIKMAAASPAELAQTGIEITNGSPFRNLAHHTRSLLTAQGFRVVHIGSDRDVGVDNTMIFYKPGSEAVARALSSRFFPGSKPEMEGNIGWGADVQIVLGKDAFEPPEVASEPAAAAEKVAAGISSPHPEVKAAPARTAPAPVVAQAKAKAPAAASTSAQATAPAAPRKTMKVPYLTASELETMAVEVRNGSGTPDLAHKARSMLSQEGFNVARIGNHIDFGAEKTIIYYRPGAEKMARNLNTRFFPHSQLQQSAKLANDISVKVLLGKDLLKRSDVMAKLSD